MPSIQLFNNPCAEDTPQAQAIQQVFLIMFTAKFKAMSGQFCFPDLPSDRHNSASTMDNLSCVLCGIFAC